MNIDFFLSSPGKDFPVDSTMLARPLLTSPTETHESLCLGDLFLAISSYFSSRETSFINEVLRFVGSTSALLRPLHSLRIRKEKQGRFYVVTSVDLLRDKKKVGKFALVCAFSAQGQAFLRNDHAHLMKLSSRSRQQYLPRVFCLDSVQFSKNNTQYPFLFCIQEWLENYWEWHIDADDAEASFSLWDYRLGFRKLSTDESGALFHQAAKILTYYFDSKTFSQIYPWHHGAGDFILRTHNGAVDVKLTTIRHHGPLCGFQAGDDDALPAAMLQFLLLMALKMRLDRVDGVGNTVWLPSSILPSLLRGFSHGLGEQVREGRLPENIFSVLEIIKRCTIPELHAVHGPLLDFLAEESESDFSLIERYLDSHVMELHNAISLR